jgi:hypothetical protein
MILARDLQQRREGLLVLLYQWSNLICDLLERCRRGERVGERGRGDARGADVLVDEDDGDVLPFREFRKSRFDS